MKSKGLQRLRWYCQACEKQCRDENGFKCHVQSESHVRQMMLVGEDPRKAINDFSNQFQRDFLLLLRTSHGEKKINLNHFYQEYIRNKDVSTALCAPSCASEWRVDMVELTILEAGLLTCSSTFT